MVMKVSRISRTSAGRRELAGEVVAFAVEALDLLGGEDARGGTDFSRHFCIPFCL